MVTVAGLAVVMVEDSEADCNPFDSDYNLRRVDSCHIFSISSMVNKN